MIITITAAVAKNRAIGKDNKLLWHLPGDLKHFREITKGKPIIMGQKTFESIGKPLPGRTNIILSLDQNFAPSGCLVARSLEEALKIAENQGSKEVIIGGGASVYRQFLPLADKMYLTLVEAEFTADAFFPEWNSEQWQETERIENQPDKENPYPYTFVVLERKKSL